MLADRQHPQLANRPLIGLVDEACDGRDVPVLHRAPEEPRAARGRRRSDLRLCFGAILQSCAERLLYEAVFAAGNHGLEALGVVVVGRCDDHRVHLRQRQKLLVPSAYLDRVGGRQGEARDGALARNVVGVSDGDDLGIGNERQIADVLLPNAPAADDTEAENLSRGGAHGRSGRP